MRAIPRTAPRKVAAIILTMLALLLSAPLVDYVLTPEGDWLNPLGFGQLQEISIGAWVLAIAFGVAFARFSVLGIPAVRATWREISLLKLVSLWVAGAAAIVEEALFRRVIMDGVAGMGGNLILQIAASAVGFGIAHAVWGLIKFDVWVAVSAVVATTIMGFGLALLYLLADRNLVPCILAHFLITAAIEPGLVLGALTGQWDRKARPAQRPAGIPHETSRRGRR